MIDYKSRAKLEDQRRSNSLVSAMKDSIASSLKSGGNEETLRLVVKREEDQQTNELLGKIGQAIAKIYGKIPSSTILPRIFKIQGDVTAKVTTIPDLKITNLSDLAPYFQSLEKRLGHLATAISLIATQSPQEIKVNQQAFDPKPIVDALKDVTISVDGEGQNQDVLGKLQEISEGIAALYNRPTLTPAPATNMNINPLEGIIKTSPIQLGSSITPMPAIALANRRSWQVYNNGTGTIYIGGSTVSSANGIPVPSGAYSDIIDAGANMVIYAISAIGQNNDCRVLEISNDNIGN